MPAVKKKPSTRLNASVKPKRAAPKSDFVDALAEAAWSQADCALAQALALFDELEPKRKDAVAAALLGQALALAARRRGLARFGTVGTLETFDPERHQLTKPSASGRVRICVRGVARGGEVLVKACAAPTRAGKGA
jgi:hypothetical protein